MTDNPDLPPPYIRPLEPERPRDFIQFEGGLRLNGLHVYLSVEPIGGLIENVHLDGNQVDFVNGTGRVVIRYERIEPPSLSHLPYHLRPNHYGGFFTHYRMPSGKTACANAQVLDAVSTDPLLVTCPGCRQVMQKDGE